MVGDPVHEVVGDDFGGPAGVSHDGVTGAGPMGAVVGGEEAGLAADVVIEEKDELASGVGEGGVAGAGRAPGG